jgi:exopolyphosphatase / guanosine-5'-triphosphate,3'-diphosphate pyrophosphatase
MTATTRVAAIDCGTNSIRLLVADRDGGELTDVVCRMEIVRLGQHVDRTGQLAPDAIERTRVALAQYAAQARELGAERIRMVATSATRDASNAAEFRAMVVRELGVEPEVITGDQEAELSFRGAVGGLTADPPHLVVDIGGGSTEFVVGTGTAEAAVSVDIGCVRMTERHLHSDPPTGAEIAAAEADIRAVVDGALDRVSAHRARSLVGLAGSVTTVTAIALDLPSYQSERVHHARVSGERVAKVAADLLSSTHERRLAIPSLHPGRADVIGAGALILRIIMEQSRRDTVIASEHDILDGIALSV